MPSWHTEQGSSQAQAAGWSLGMLLKTPDGVLLADLTLRRGNADRASLEVGEA